MIKIVPGSTLKQQNEHANTLCLSLSCTQDIYDLTMKAISLIDSKFSPRDAVKLGIFVRTDFQMIDDARLPFGKHVLNEHNLHLSAHFKGIQPNWKFIIESVALLLLWIIHIAVLT